MISTRGPFEIDAVAKTYSDRIVGTMTSKDAFIVPVLGDRPNLGVMQVGALCPHPALRHPRTTPSPPSVRALTLVLSVEGRLIVV
jgi:hypothetical protein